MYSTKSEKFSKVVVEDSNLAYIDEKTFKAVQEVLDRIRRKYSSKPQAVTPQCLAKEFGPLESPDVAVLCSRCGGRMVRNGLRPLVGGPFVQNWLCRKCRIQKRYPGSRELKRIQREKGITLMSSRDDVAIPREMVIAPVVSSLKSNRRKRKEHARRKIGESARAGEFKTLDEFFCLSTHG